MKPYVRFFAVLVCSTMLLTTTGCDDPSNVGLGVGGDLGGGTPTTLELAPTSFAADSIRDITGNSNRVLIGQVQDPIAGRITSTGYIDLNRPNNPTTGFVEGPVRSAELRLFPNYVYGDTVDTVTLGVYDMNQEWPSSGLPSDTTLVGFRGDLITEFSFSPTDSVVTVEMPEAWVQANDEVLRDTSSAFVDRFHGFQIAPVEGANNNAVVGFNRLNTQLRATADVNPIAFPVIKTFSGMERSDENIPADRFLLQDGLGTAVSFTFNLPDSLKDAPLNRAAIQLTADTSGLGATLPNNQDFIRPRITQASLLGVPTGSDAPLTISTLSYDGEGRYIFEGDQNQIQTLFQEALLGNPQIDRYILRLTPTSNTLNSLLVFGPNADPDRQPRALITVTLSQ